MRQAIFVHYQGVSGVPERHCASDLGAQSFLHFPAQRLVKIKRLRACLFLFSKHPTQEKDTG